MKIGFLGAGRMAEGILSSIDDKSAVIMADKSAERARELRAKYGVRVVSDLGEVLRFADFVFLAVRPQDVAAVAEATRGELKARHTLVSIVAGKTISRLSLAFGRKAAIVRVMPNLALRAKAGMCAICARPSVPKSRISAVMRILSGAGEAVVLRERDFDAVTALSGSGPAYFAYMEAAMAEGGVALGLRPEIARLLAEQTMYGTAKFLRESKMDLSSFIDGVCTKGGTTAAGMERLANPQFKRIVASALKAAARRSRKLA